VTAKLDRLPRSARFLLSVVETGALFCDLLMGPTGPARPIGWFLNTQMAAGAALEPWLISQRARPWASRSDGGSGAAGLAAGQRTCSPCCAACPATSPIPRLPSKQRNSMKSCHRSRPD
jgi:hypothetical protein